MTEPYFECGNNTIGQQIDKIFEGCTYGHRYDNFYLEAVDLLELSKYERRAMKGDAVAMNNLGYIYLELFQNAVQYYRGTEDQAVSDKNSAKKWFTRVIEQSSDPVAKMHSQKNLSVMSKY